jgi:pimeloyl-ACP methyl ester carboxylesterase
MTLNISDLFSGIPERVDHYLQKKFERAQLKQREVILDSMKIEYWDTEAFSKPVLLLIHGFGADSKIQWIYLVKKLSKTHRLIVPNLLYFGNSDDSTKITTTFRQVEMVECLLSFLSVDTFSVAGISYGTLIAMYLAERHPNVEKVVLMSTPAYGEEVILQATLLKNLKAKTFVDVLIPENASDMKRLMKVGYAFPPPLPDKMLKQFIPSVVGLTRTEKTALLIDLVEQREEYVGRHKKITQPLLIIVGEKDPLTPKEIAANFQKHYPNAIIHRIRKTAHLPMLERPKAVRKLLIPFLVEA